MNLLHNNGNRKNFGVLDASPNFYNLVEGEPNPNTSNNHGYCCDECAEHAKAKNKRRLFRKRTFRKVAAQNKQYKNYMNVEFMQQAAPPHEWPGTSFMNCCGQ